VGAFTAREYDLCPAAVPWGRPIRARPVAPPGRLRTEHGEA